LKTEKRRKGMERIGDRILALLKQSGYTQKELASMVGVTEAAMCRYVRNEREPKIEVVANLATALNTTSDYLINGRKEDSSFDEVYRLVARSTSAMSDEEKMKLMALLIKR
jgi:transcriptional regulator with XRE-family HTH domain